jgi:branched-chain amino acid transport system substrate-binding protein
VHYQLERRQLLRIFGAVAAAGATAGLAAACSADQGSDEPQTLSGQVRIGLVLPSGGPFAQVGRDIQRGFQLYLDGNNNQLGPFTAEIVAVDEGTTAASSVAAVKSLLTQQVVAVVGVTNPDALIDLTLPTLQAYTPLLCTHAAPSTLTNALFLWRTSCVLGDAGRSIVSYARTVGSKAYVFSDGSTIGTAEAAAFKSEFVDGHGQIVGETVGTANLANRLQNAETQGADVIFAAFSGADAQAMLDAYRASGSKAKLLGPASLTDTFDLPTKEQMPEGVYTSNFYAADLTNEANGRFVTAYYQQYSVQPTGYSTAGYDSAAILAGALRTLESSPSGSKLNQAFSRLGQIDSPRGAWAFNINRTPQQRWYLRRLQLDGKVPANLLDSDLAVQG